MPENNSTALPTMTAAAQAVSEALGDSSRRKLMGLVAADRLMGMGFAARSHLMAERLARKTVDGTIGQRTEEPEDEALRNMNISVGDTVHITPPPAQVAASTPASAVAPAAAKKLWPYVLAAALGSGGLGLGASALLNLLSATPAPVAQEDTNTQYELRISSGEQPAK